MYKVEKTSRFKKKEKLLRKRGYDMSELNTVIEMLKNDEILDWRYHDHQLYGDKRRYRECHIKPNWILIYQKIENILILSLIDTGTHDEVFNTH